QALRIPHRLGTPPVHRLRLPRRRLRRLCPSAPRPFRADREEGRAGGRALARHAAEARHLLRLPPSPRRHPLRRAAHRAGPHMHPLVLLYKLQAKALYRRLTRNLRSVKGAFLFIVGVLVIGLWLAPSLWQAVRSERTDPAAVCDVAPVILLAMCLLTLVSSGG